MDARADVQTATKSAVLLGIADDERTSPIQDLSVGDVDVVDVEGLPEDHVEIGKADAADDHQPLPSELLHRATVVGNFLAKLGKHEPDDVQIGRASCRERVQRWEV